MDQDHQERIKRRAHEIWESEGRPEGRDAEHWSRAEEELRTQTDGESQGGDDSQPELAQTEAAEKPRRAPRKSAKPAQADPTPYLNDGA
ncbi:DUF2934 domain-containing protein [Paracoccus sp. S3-43]|uniref:DUF2934 domain-containing protein n=1 Tax=Paracoccus sp. S3-43 TaxID=3030011 RepID=UPI0023B0A0DB|nr:DUF2934 domain-containing protein [Paracoccus sp. S3-43]WEF23050.1 DUF2934 domain-containing protein [Paracoccus sp. S3-43]